MNFNLASEDYKKIRRQRILKRIFIFAAVLCAAGAIWAVLAHTSKVKKEASYSSIPENTEKSSSEASIFPEMKWHFNPGPISMDLIKKKGCVTDGFLSSNGDSDKELVKMIDRSQCVYLHRAL